MRTMNTLAAAHTPPWCQTTINSIYTNFITLKELTAANISFHCNDISSSTILTGLNPYQDSFKNPNCCCCWPQWQWWWLPTAQALFAQPNNPWCMPLLFQYPNTLVPQWCIDDYQSQLAAIPAACKRMQPWWPSLTAVITPCPNSIVDIALDNATTQNQWPPSLPLMIAFECLNYTAVAIAWLDDDNARSLHTSTSSNTSTLSSTPTESSPDPTLIAAIKSLDGFFLKSSIKAQGGLWGIFVHR